eukprot:CAMPEP_0185023922 /NCGR_PEP_ID=MMETSP1103-20130426/6610_1 /TAXON_ID=36769 /ORGANISM="Paraphysomonas bandaiensis, Strain Caron Lab Isolate" /LENGTH=168 /DNA_ID=CAMNT_0027556719 /DNA_START=168 /DNA_END=674 /DNA_ORIENTATION=-
MAIPVSNPSVVSMSEGSYVTTVYTTPNCAANSTYTATGTSLGSCISVDSDTSYMYSDCSASGSKVTVTMTTCTSSDCSSGCQSFKLPQESNCQTMSTITCTSADDPWKEGGFNFHSEMHWGADDCGGKYDMWTGIHADCDDLDCDTYEGDNGSKYSLEGFCEDNDDNN